MILALLPLLFAHGGEDHAASAPVEARAEGARAASWSSEFEAVLDLGASTPGAPLDATLYVADFNTSAPLEAGAATLAFQGPQSVSAEVRSGPVPGVWTFHPQFPEAGDYAASMTLVTPNRADALGFPPLTVGAPVEGGGEHAAPVWPVALAVGLVCLALGVALGRRWALAGALLLSARLVQAHGGEDHSVAAPVASPVAATGGLRLPMEGQFLLGLRTTRAGPRPFVEQVDALGAVVARPGGHATLRAPVSGTFSLSRALLPGTPVRAGEVLGGLAEALGGLDRAALARARAEAELGLAQAQAALALAERDASRGEGLGEVLSERERMQRSQALTLAREQVRAAEAALAAAPSAQTPLRAPLDGRVTGVLARPGDTVSAGDELLHIAAPGALWVEARVPETRAGQLGLDATLRADARPDVPLQATLLDPGLEADPVSGMLRLVLVVNEPPPWLVPGMSVTASLNLGEPREALTVPDDAVVDSQGETLVFVKTGPETFEVRRVRVGARSGEDREVQAGLGAGERVVVTGTYNLRSLAGR